MANYINSIPSSNEEMLIFLYLEELKENGFIKEIIFQPENFNLFDGIEKKLYKNKQLKTKIKKNYSKNKYLIGPRIYTSDFKIIWNLDNFNNKLLQDISNDEINQEIPFIFHKIESNTENIGVSYLEVKGNFDKHGDQRLFNSRTQPWIWEKYKIFIQIIIPKILFKNTFVPKEALNKMFYKKKTKNYNIGDKKYNFEYKTLKQFLNN